MDEFTGNSFKAKEEDAQTKKIEKVVTGNAKVKKKSDFQKLVDVFIPEDVNNVKDYIVMDVLIPAAKKTIVDVISCATDRLFYGEPGSGRSRGNSITRESRVSYGSYYNSGRRGDIVPDSSSYRAGYNYNEIILETRAEAEDVLDSLNELIEVYKMASVADLYDLVGVTGDYTDVNYGWKTIRNANIVRDKDGYILKMPRPLPLK